MAASVLATAGRASSRVAGVVPVTQPSGDAGLPYVATLASSEIRRTFTYPHAVPDGLALATVSRSVTPEAPTAAGSGALRSNSM